MDKIDFFVSNDDLAVNHTVCAAFAKGKSVQYKESGKWYDYNANTSSELFGPWCYKSTEYSWRVKPDTLKITYRVALMKSTKYYTMAADENTVFTEAALEKRCDFVKWLGEAVTKEVEIG